MTRVTAPREIAKLTRSLSTTAAAPRASRLPNSLSKTTASRVRKELEQQDASTSEHPRVQADPTAMDFAVLPSADMLWGGADAAVRSSRVRVPLLPDNFAPARSPTVGHLPEAPDAPLAAPEIVIMAADPSSVNAVSPLSEVEGMGPDGVELKFVHDYAGGAARSGTDGEGQYAGGMLKNLWNGIVDDVLGGGQGKMKPAM